jgi:hypothetical protein
MDDHAVICREFSMSRYIFIHEVTDAVVTIDVPYLESSCRKTGVVDVAEASGWICLIPLGI